MAYTYGGTKYKETYDYWELWNKKDNRVEKYFLSQWDDQFSRIRKLCQTIEKDGEYIKSDFDHEDAKYSLYIGSVFSIVPSGKYYMPFASSNVSVKEAAIDELWHEKFEELLSEEDCWYESGEGDPCDMFICKVAPKHRAEDITDEDFDRILKEIINEDYSAEELLAIPGIYEILSEYFNNRILKIYEDE